MKSTRHLLREHLLLALAPLLIPAALSTQAADRNWTGGTASYTNAANWTGGVVPGPTDNAINNNGLGNAVQINPGNGDWTIYGLGAGTGTGSGAFQQNGQTVTVNGSSREVRLGAVAGQTGAYTLNGGTLIITNGEFDLGILGQATLAINGGSLYNSGTLAVNVGSSLSGVSATMDGSTNKDGFTWFEQGFYTTDSARGVPTAGSSLTSQANPDHTYNMPANYTGNSVVMIDTNVASATLTLSTPTALSALSFLGSAGHGPVAVNYVVHHADSSVEPGTLSVPDWFDGNTPIAYGANGRSPANGLGIQLLGGFPYLFDLGITLTNTTSPVTSVSLSYGNAGGVASLFALSGSTGSGFTPVSFSGANADLVLEANAPIYVASTVTNAVTQVAGIVTNTGEVWVGNYGAGTWTMSGGTNSFQNWTALGRSGGYGTLNISGGEVDKNNNGDFLVGTGYQAPDGSTPTGIVNQSGGVINCDQSFLVPENSPAYGYYNLSGSGVLNAHSWLVIGRNGGIGTFNMTGGTINKTGGNNIIIADSQSSTGVATQSGGTVTSTGELWVGQNTGNGTYNLSGTGVLTINNWVAIGRDNGSGLMNVDGGTFTKGGDNGSHLIIGSSGVGTLNQTAGTIINTASDTWLAESSTGTWNINGGTVQLGLLQVARNGSANGSLNLNGGTVTLSELAGGSGSSSVTFNGSTLVASTANPNFIHNLGAAYVTQAGLILDSAGFDVAVPQSLGDGGAGALVKNGAGSLTLSGVNTYSGPTTINAGKVATTTASALGGGSITLANGTEFALAVAAANGQISAASLSLNGTASTLDFDLGNFGNPTTAPVTVPGTLSVSGTVTINVAEAVPAVGQFPLIAYGTKSGAGTFALGSLPPGVVAHLVDNTANHSIDLAITSAGAPRWDGQVSGTPNGNWDINNTPNWIDAGTLSPTTYQNGKPTLFDDNATGTTTVNVTTAVTPGALTVNNTNLNYTFVGSGSINGTIGLVKQGSGTVTVLNNNGYTGPTLISGGVVSVTNLANGGVASPLGASSASPNSLVLAGGALAYNGPATTINRGYSVQSGGGTIDTEANLTLSGVVAASSGSGFTKTGPAQLAYVDVGSNALAGADYLLRAGSMVLDGSAGPQTNTIAGALSVAGATSATALLTNATLTANDNYIGNVPGTFGSMTVSGSNSVLNVNSWLLLGDGAGSVSSFTLNSGTVNVPNGRIFLCSSPSTIATLNINGGTINKNSGDIICIADGGWNGSGARTGTVNQVSGTFNSTVENQIGNTATATAIYNLHGGAINSSGWFVIGRSGAFGTFNMDGGVLTHTSGGQPAFIVGSGAGNNNNLGSIGVLNQSAGTINCTSEYWVAENTGTEGTNNISGTAAVNVANWVSLGRGGHAVVNFSGGTFTKTGGGNFIIGDGGNAYLNQTGGTLTINSELWIGQSGSGVGRYDLSAGTVTVDNWVAVGRAGANGTLNISGGSLTKNGGSGNHITIASGGPGTVNQTGGTITSTLSSTFIGEGGQPGVWNMNGGSAVLALVDLPINSGANGTLNLNGGTFSATEITSGNAGGTGTLNFNGGTLVAGLGASANFLHNITAANVLAGGAVIDSGANVVSIAQPLLDGTGGGGLTKLGTGTLYLNGANTYTGPTLVNVGTLGGSGTIVGAVTVAAGANLAPGAGVGTLTVNNNVNLGGALTMEVSKNGGVPTSDLLAVSGALNCGGTLNVVLTGTNGLAYNDTFHLLSWGSRSGSFATLNLPAGYLWDTTQLTVNGTIRVAGFSPAVVNPAKVVNGKLVLTGVGGPAGGSYSWLTSTNVAAPLATWTTNTTGVFDSNAAFSNAIPVNVNEPARFFRLKTP